METAHIWWKDPTLWMQVVIQLLVTTLYLSAGSDITGFNRAAFYDIPVFAQWVLEGFGWISIVALNLGLILQRWYSHAGLWVIFISLIVFVFSPWIAIPIGYLVVCHQSWFIAAYIHRGRKAWLITLVVGSIVGMFVSTLFPGVVLPVKDPTQPRLTEFFDSHAALFGSLMGIVQAIVSIALFWNIGLVTRRRNERYQMLKDHAEMSAVVERNRIAREIHDVIAHCLTVIIAQADGGRFAGKKDPAQALDALATISQVGRNALTEVRTLLSVLGASTHDERSLSTTPGLDAIRDLIRETERAGAQVNYRILGEPRDVTEIVGLSIFRILQETLTNALKHAGAVPIDITMDWTNPTLLHISVLNDAGTGLVDKPRTPGRGLIGLEERAKLHGGTAEITTDHDNRWCVMVTLPI
ncbi:histidine kinase [Corynebacterium felinum]|uniref:histidine kinase n=1 Tax=Corynebacterium felinum TaxID=131318 RepID=A0ABU2BB59_9CORY|nr:histidine kinase [Corynebacterium felinum]MDF5820884.1 histidine kinase [Corynebacterium felinum]MDR7354604.1 signal transduction histidine kinase [Corynebacterium felinum]WJY93969.1 Sensor histidine kinase DesK [Corynebacterium felinum]